MCIDAGPSGQWRFVDLLENTKASEKHAASVFRDLKMQAVCYSEKLVSNY
jgi:hypothetical protein